MCAPYTCSTYFGQKRASEPLELELLLEGAAALWVLTENQTQALRWFISPASEEEKL